MKKRKEKNNDKWNIEVKKQNYGMKKKKDERETCRKRKGKIKKGKRNY